MGNSLGCSASGERLVSAARDGDFVEAKMLLDCNPCLAKYSTFGGLNSPLHFASAKGHIDIVALLLDTGADVNSRNYCGQTALMQACRYGHWEVVQTLMLFRCNVTRADYLSGRTALHFASVNGHVRCIRLVVADFVPSSPFECLNSQVKGDKRSASAVKGKHDQSALAKFVNKAADGGITALHMAALNGYFDCVQLLLNLQANVSAVTFHYGTSMDLIGAGSTPLHYAACGGNLKCCQILLASGASRLTLNCNGWLPLDVARMWGRHWLEPFLAPNSEQILPKPKMESPNGVGDVGGSSDPGAMARTREDANMSRSGSDNLEAASGDGQEQSRNKSRKRAKYHRHTPDQIQELEAVFKENNHPDEKERLELGRKLNMEHRQIKFWFQNKRTHMKAQVERHENLSLKQENDNLRIENLALKEALKNLICGKCGGQQLLAEISTEEKHLRIENAVLKDELDRARAWTNKIVRPLSSFGGTSSPPMLNTNLEVAARRNGLGSLGNVHTALSIGLNPNNAVSDSWGDGPMSRPLIGMHPVNPSFQDSMFFELASTATDEIIKLAENDTRLWFRSLAGSGERLNFDEYMKVITPCVDITSRACIDGTRATSLLAIRSTDLVEVLMNADQWAEMFSEMIGSSSTLEVISGGINGTKNCALQLMQAEIQVISPLVPVRQMRFLRFCRQHVNGAWVVVDVSIDNISEGVGSQTFSPCRRLPSGCILQDMPNGCSKVTWVEHCEYFESAIHSLYRPLIRCGMGYGAQRWMAHLQKHCDFLNAIMSSTVSGENHSVITPDGRRSLAKLAQRMNRIFCAGVCATGNKWEVVQLKNMGDDSRFLVRKGIPDPGEPSEVVLSATMSVRMPVQPHQLFGMLKDEEHRSRWDILSHGGSMEKIICISKGQADYGKSISVLRPTGITDDMNQNNMLRLQATSTDISGSLIVYAAVDMSSMTLVLNGGDSSSVALLPSGFAVVPDCVPRSEGGSSCNGGVPEDNTSSGSLLTVSFQILLNNLPMAKLTEESIDTVKTLMSRAVQGIKDVLGCD